MSNIGEEIAIRNATIQDAEAILDIYTYYVLNTAITFEEAVPSLSDFEKRIQNTLELGYPYLIAEQQGKVLGYAYGSPFVMRAAYNWSCDLSIYLRADERGHGLGHRLYEAFESRVREMGIRNVYACIAYPEKEDEYLTLTSPRFHARQGFREVGLCQKCSYKFGRWYNMIWMEKLIGDHDEHPSPVAGLRPQWG